MVGLDSAELRVFGGKNINPPNWELNYAGNLSCSYYSALNYNDIGIYVVLFICELLIRLLIAS